jgi:hypothetical protein
MKELVVNIWRHPPKDEVIVDGEKIPHDVLIRIRFHDVPRSTTLGELFDTFPHQTFIPLKGGNA